MLSMVRLRPRHLFMLGPIGLALAFLVSCRANTVCLFSSGRCGGDEQSLSPAPEPAASFGPTDPTLDGGCDDSIRHFDMAGPADGGDGGGAAAPGSRCSSPSDCAPVSCSCGDGGAAPPDDDAGDAESDGGGDGGDLDAEATSHSGVRLLDTHVRYAARSVRARNALRRVRLTNVAMTADTARVSPCPRRPDTRIRRASRCRCGAEGHEDPRRTGPHRGRRRVGSARRRGSCGWWRHRRRTR
jgi:hypothetical protein